MRRRDLSAGQSGCICCARLSALAQVHHSPFLIMARLIFLEMLEAFSSSVAAGQRQKRHCFFPDVAQIWSLVSQPCPTSYSDCKLDTGLSSLHSRLPERRSPLLCSGLISSWSVAMNDLGYTGALSASCSDGSELQEIRYGYNGTANSTCDWGLQLATNISNPANKTYSYK